ncbi:MAG: glycosyltransferase family 4 protein, partial [Mycobacterium sp.]|nr:glycosyltransferase family 4 protein [Mycobacterium sp.]
GLAQRALTSLPAVVAAAGFTLRLAALLRALDVDVVHTNSLKADLLGGIAARLAGKPLVWYVHDRITADYLPSPLASGLRWTARHLPHQVLANSQATLNTLLPLPAGRYAVAYPGLEPAAFTGSGPLRERWVIGMIGRISPTKGQDVFLRAAARLLTTHPGVRFVVVGAALFNEAEYERQVRALACSLGLEGQVRFTGQLSDPAAEMRRFDVLVHASPVPEPFGQVITEAMAAGVPVIATAGGGATEIVRGDCDLGRLVPPGDDAALAGAMRDLLDNPGEAGQMAERARVAVADRFGIDRTAEAVTAAWLRAARRPS